MKSIAIDMAGKKCGCLMVIARHGSRSRKALWLCRCTRCGVERVVVGCDLRSGKAGSCRCATVTHGATRHYSKTPEYTIWQAMLQRCYNPKTRHYDRYGGRGVVVHPRWRFFEYFLADVGPRPIGRYSLHRLDNDGDYAPGNVQWVTYKEQNRKLTPADFSTERLLQELAKRKVA